MTDKDKTTATPGDRQRVADHLRACGMSTICAVQTSQQMPAERVAEYCRRLGDWKPTKPQPAGVIERRPE